LQIDLAVMEDKIKNIKNWQAAILICVLGIAVYATGLHSPFWDDDLTQIVNSLPVHSIAHIKILFEGGTFDSGQSLGSPLDGVYYRPLVLVVYSLTYTLFGPHPFMFHVVQLALAMSSAFVFYLVLKHVMRPILAICMALIFLVHPIDSQAVFSIPSLQEPLFFLFGITALWLLITYRSTKTLIAAVLCLFLSLLAKETALGFIVVSGIYLYWFNRQRLWKFGALMVLPFTLYIVLRINAVGLLRHETVAPIETLSLIGRLYTAPSIMLFYVSKLIFPWKLASDYFWVYPHFNVTHVFIPLLIDCLIMAGILRLGFMVRKRLAQAMFYTYLLFGVWAVFGILICINIIPLDGTAFEPWFYFSMAAILGMIGVVLEAYKVRLVWFLPVFVILICLYGVRTSLRGLDWEYPNKLAYLDVSASPENYIAYTNIANDLYAQGHYEAARVDLIKSVGIFPTASAYSDLGEIDTRLSDYRAAQTAFADALKYGNPLLAYQQFAEFAVLDGTPALDSKLFTDALRAYPTDPTLLSYLAVVEQEYGDSAKAKFYMAKSARYGQVSPILYDDIMANEPVNLSFANVNKTITVK
jgi:hypothetical protein